MNRIFLTPALGPRRRALRDRLCRPLRLAARRRRRRRRARRAAHGAATPQRGSTALRRGVPLFLGIAARLPAPRLLSRAGSASRATGIDLGILILTYVMLGWGLNIVVGLAGLLDLGYVAFYAVGAYSYALLSTTFGLSFWICLPLAGILAAFWGIMLGFPVLRLRGDYLAIVTLAFGEIIRLVLINWVDLTNGGAGISVDPAVTFFGIPFNAERGRLRRRVRARVQRDAPDRSSSTT